MCHIEILSNFVARTAVLVLLVFLLSTPSCVIATSTGSNTAPSREAFVTYAGAGNTINGFAGMYNGFMLSSDYTTVVTFNSSFPVSTSMTLNGGTINLLQNLFLDGELIIGALGTIIGNNHTVEFAPHNQKILLPYLGGLSYINTQGAGPTPYTADWSVDGKYIAQGTASLFGTGSELYVDTFDGRISFTASFTLGLDVNSVAWQPVTEPPYYLVAGTNSGLYAFQFNPLSSTLILTSSIATGTIVSAVAWHPSGKWVAAGKNFPTEEIAIYNFNAGLLTTNTGYDFVPSQSVSRGALDFDYTGSYLAVGVNNANQLQLLHWNGTSLTLTVSANTGAIVNTVSWSPDGSLIAIGMNSGAYPIQVYSFNRKANALTLLPSYATVAGAPINSIDWSPDGRSLISGCSSGYQLLIFAVNTATQRFVLIGEAGFSAAINTVKWY